MSRLVDTHRKIVCICGSTRFCDAKYEDEHHMNPWQRVNYEQTLAGHIVLTIGCDTKADNGLPLTDIDKANLDALHLDKILLADEIIVINVGGYIGESTAREIAFANAHHIPVRLIEARRI